MTSRTAALFVTALLGVVVVVGLVLAPLGWAAEAPYLVLVLAGATALVRRARDLRRRRAARAGRTCSCCTSTVFDPVEVR